MPSKKPDIPAETQRPPDEKEAAMLAEVLAGGRECEVSLTTRGCYRAAKKDEKPQPKPFKLWWTHQGSNEGHKIRAAAMTAAKDEEKAGLLHRYESDGRVQLKPMEDEDGQLLGAYLLPEPCTIPSTVRIWVGEGEARYGSDFHVAGNLVFFAGAVKPDRSDVIGATFAYYDQDIYEEVTSPARTAATIYACLREADDHAKRFFDGYDELPSGERVHRGSLYGVAELADGEMAAIFGAVNPDAPAEDVLPNSPESSSGVESDALPTGTS